MSPTRRSPFLVFCFFCACIAAFLLTACGGGDGQASGAAAQGAPAAGGGSSAPASSGGAAPASNQGQSPMGILVPAYFDGGPSSPWSDLVAARQDYPQVPITAILNPSNGNFSKADPGIASAIAAFTAVGGKVVGYVDTLTAQRALGDVETNVDNYVTYYGSSVSGVFLDNMGGPKNLLPYFQNVADYVHKNHPGLEIIGNPGTYPDSGYANVADVLVIFENPMSRWNVVAPGSKNNLWVQQRSNGGQAVIAYGATCADMQNVASAAATGLNVGWVYTTDLDGSNPWAGLPSYWSQLLGTVNAINGNQSSAPSC